MSDSESKSKSESECESEFEFDIEALLADAVGEVPALPAGALVARFRHGDDRRDLLRHAAVGVSVIALLAGVAGAVGVLRPGNSQSRVAIARNGDPADVASRPVQPDDDLEVFLEPDATREEIAAVRQRLDDEALVGATRYIDQGSFYVEFVTLFADQPTMFESVKPTDLPSLFRVNLSEESCAALHVIGALQHMPGVREIVNRMPIAC